MVLSQAHHQTYLLCQNKNLCQGAVGQGNILKKICSNYHIHLKANYRWLSQGRSSTRHLLPTLSVAETAFTERTSSQSETNTPDRPELSEAECDIDTLKKLKLGLRSSLWSRPAGSGQPSDYSIAV